MIGAAFVLSAAFVIGGWSWTWFALRDIHTPIILRFSDYTGINQIGGINDIHAIGATGCVLILVNLMLVRELQSRRPEWAGILSGATLLIAILLFMALAAIMSVNQ